MQQTTELRARINLVTRLEGDTLVDENAQLGASAAFDWRNCWYPVTFLEDLPRDRPTAFSLYDEPLVLFADGTGDIVCLRDRCAHRAARLSDGHIIDGRLECFYHGWQYGADGRCLHIPQLAEGARLPPRACVRAYPVAVKNGMVWFWAGDPELADESLMPLTKGIDDPSVTCVDFQMDLPYDQSYLIENVIDVAHIHIAHDGMRGGGLRSAAKPLEFDILERSVKGIRSHFKTVGMPESSVLKHALVEYVAPNLIRYTSQYRNEALMAGLDLYSIPSGKGRCRLLYRKYSNFTQSRERWKPRWLEHWTQCTILEQDMSVVIGQHEHIERAQGHLGNLWCTLNTSDRLVVEYRKWLDQFGHGLPFYRGLATSRSPAPDPFAAPASPDRYSLHTRICNTCSRVHRRIKASIRTLWIAVILLAATSIVTGGTWISIVSIAATLLSLSAIACLKLAQSRFE